MLRNKEEVIRRLQGKPASRAVRWYDPNVLVQAGIRDVLAAVFGEYADQRLMQAATDLVDKDGLKARYDYSDRAEQEWGKSIRIDEATQAYWVDYIADALWPGTRPRPPGGRAWRLRDYSCPFVHSC